MSVIKNPILKGFHPDPSICRVGDDFYLVNSTFAYFPGVPIFHSRDLVNWQQIGNVLDRNSQVDLTDINHSEGVYAPTIRFNDGIFYVITTNIPHGGNFIVKAENPRGPWSDPYKLEGAEGIDPSLFFDDDGKAYYIGTRPRKEGLRYDGDWEVWIQQLDLKKMCLVGESHAVWNGAMRNVIWPEGPHLYKKDGYYYVMTAEGGTGSEHSITIARSRDIFGTYLGNPSNPIITHRHLGKEYPIKNVGHGDLVKTEDGQWFIVMLASRTCEGHCNLGRETFLAKVIWEDGWPVINPGKGILELEQQHSLREYKKEMKECCTHFYKKELDYKWLCLRNPSSDMYSLNDRKGCLCLYLKKETLKDLANPAYLAIRQEDYNYLLAVMMEFTPHKDGESAGIAIVQSNKYYLKYVYTRTNGRDILKIIKAVDGREKIISASEVNAQRLSLKIVSRGQNLDFYYAVSDDDYNLLIENVRADDFSTETAGGFVGCTLGMYASSNGSISDNFVDYFWFEYSYQG